MNQAKEYVNMEVQIISQEIIKSSAPTPHHLRTYKLSGMDQIAALAYVPVILFYSPTNEMSSKNSDYLKKAFSETLTLFLLGYCHLVAIPHH
jgi:shikimate O-hydroxycinnamoyltransferase